MGNKSSSFSGKKYNGIRERANFESHGPRHLPKGIWWQKEEHQLCVAACFINGVYVLEHARRAGLVTARDLAKPWWESFGYVLEIELVNPKDNSIFGAVYTRSSTLPESTPLKAVAFRGTVTDYDQKTAGLMPFRDLGVTSIFKVALQALSDFNQGDNIWLCGHSLGAAIALLAGKVKAKRGIYFNTFLFNPPIVLNHLEKAVLSLTSFVLGLIPFTAIPWLIALLETEAAEREELMSAEAQKAFTNLCVWTPRLLVNPGDFICNGYIKYYEEREKKKKKKMKKKVPVTTELTHEELNLPYVIPSVRLIRNTGTVSTDGCHGIKQWWQGDLNLQSQLYSSN